MQIQARMTVAAATSLDTELVAAPAGETVAGFMPDAGDEVTVAFEPMTLRAPYVVGALWNTRDDVPASASGPATGHRAIHEAAKQP
ncbi:MAG TPA: phage baseplate assembly protein V [Burkholderiaceae bacterium]|nr:phage baseplate assembly protein V [Burkholderiaceae bacterium]